MPVSELVKIILIGVISVVFGCSPPEGGYVEPTPAQIVHFATHVVVGEVTETLEPDPMFGDTYRSTYGAMVTVQCTYKGMPLPGRIKIGGAGFIPGMCEAMPLDKGIKYVLFLREKRDKGDLYEQSSPAVNKTKLGDFLNVCDLDMQYPEEQGMTLPRKQCPPVTQLDTCQRYTVDGGASNTKPVNVDSQSIPKSSQGGTQQQKKETSQATGNDGGGAACHMTTSFAAILVPLAFVLLH